MPLLSTTLLLVLASGSGDTFDSLDREETKQVDPLAPAIDKGIEPASEVAAPSRQADEPGAFVPQASRPSSSPVSEVVQRSDGKPPLPWRVIAGAGTDHQHGDAMEWFGSSPSPTAQLRGELRFDWLVDGLGASVGAGFWSRGTWSHDRALAVAHAEGEIGAVLDLPADGFWDLVYPYARLGLLLGYARVRAGDELADGVVVPGTSVSAGTRLMFGRGTARGQPRFFAYGEGGYAYRLPRIIKLTRVETDQEEPLLAGPAIRLGDLKLSGATWRVGLGVAF